MSEFEKVKYRLNIKSVTVISLILLSAVIFIWIATGSDAKNVAFDNENTSALRGEWILSYNGKEENITLPYQADAGAEDVVSVRRVLRKEDVSGNSLMFYARQCWVEVIIDGKIIEDSAENRKVPFAMTPGSYWHYFRLPEDFDGKTIEINFKPALNKYAGEIPVIYSGNKSAFVYMIIKNATPSLILMGSVLLIGIAMLVFGIASTGSFMGTRLMRMGLFAITSSVWLILESRVTQIFTGNMVVASYLLFACYFMIPFLACSLLLTYETMKDSKFMNFLFWVSAVLAVVVHLLQITGIVYYIELVPLMHIMLICIVADSLITFINLKRKNAEVTDKSIYKAMLLLGTCCILDALQYYIFPDAIIGNFSKVGILLFFGYLGYIAITIFGRAEVQEAENRIYKQLAYTDMMTGIKNRTAFEAVVSELREKPSKSETILLIVDMNRLKFINDNYGHSKGDDAIIAIAEHMTREFSENCQCFRIGGDEFAVISKKISENVFRKMCDTFKERISETEIADGVMLSVSCGYSVVGEDGIDECYKKADALMYRQKTDSKQKRD